MTQGQFRVALVKFKLGVDGKEIRLTSTDHIFWNPQKDQDVVTLAIEAGLIEAEENPKESMNVLIATMQVMGYNYVADYHPLGERAFISNFSF